MNHRTETMIVFITGQRPKGKAQYGDSIMKTKVKPIYQNEFYQAAKQQLDDLLSQEKMLKEEIEHARKTQQQDRTTTEKARALINGQPLVAVSTQQCILDDLYGKLRVIKKATQLQQQKLTEIQTEVGAELCRQLEPEAKAAAAATYEAIQVLIDAMELEVGFYNSLRGLGLNTACRPAHWTLRPSLQRLTCLGMHHGDNLLQKALNELKQYWSLK